MKETSDDEGPSLSKGEEGRYCTGQEYLDWRLEADGGELIRRFHSTPPSPPPPPPTDSLTRPDSALSAQYSQCPNMRT